MYKRIFIIIIFIVSINFILLFLQNKNNNIKCNEDDFGKYIGFYKQNFDKFNLNIDNRFVIKDEYGLSIGKNKNELDNGYYDVKVIVKEKDFEIYINKLFKEFNSNQFYDEIYINEIVEAILKLFNLKIKKDEIIRIIIDNYISIRNINRANVESVDKTLEIDKIKINIIVYQNILVLKMGDTKWVKIGLNYWL